MTDKKRCFVVYFMNGTFIHLDEGTTFSEASLAGVDFLKFQEPNDGDVVHVAPQNILYMGNAYVPHAWT